MAFGATPADVQRLVAAAGVKLAAIGGALGLLGAASLSRTVTGLLFEAQPMDPITYLAIVGILSVTVLVACWMPARRAANIGSAGSD